MLPALPRKYQRAPNKQSPPSRTACSTRQPLSQTLDTMPPDPRTVPVIIGVGRTTQRKPASFRDALSPSELRAKASRLACDDTAVLAIAGQIDSIAVVESATRTRALLNATVHTAHGDQAQIGLRAQKLWSTNDGLLSLRSFTRCWKHDLNNKQ